MKTEGVHFVRKEYFDALQSRISKAIKEIESFEDWWEWFDYVESRNKALAILKGEDDE